MDGHRMFNTFRGKVINWWRWGEAKGCWSCGWRGRFAGTLAWTEHLSAPSFPTSLPFPSPWPQHNVSDFLLHFSYIFGGMELVDALENTQIGCRGMFYLASFHFERIGHCPHPPVRRWRRGLDSRYSILCKPITIGDCQDKCAYRTESFAVLRYRYLCKHAHLTSTT